MMIPAARLSPDRALRSLAWLMLLTGCGQIQPRVATTGPADETGRSLLRLTEIPPTPELPAGQTASAVEPSPATQRYIQEGHAHFEQRRWSEAIAAAEKALQADERCADAQILWARAALRLGEIEKARTRLAEALKQRPRDAGVYRLLGEIAWQQNQTAEAVRALRLALAACEGRPDSPECPLAHMALALVLRKEGYLTAAADELEEYLSAVQRASPEAMRLPELREAVEFYRGKAEALIGEIQTELGRHDKAVAAYRRAAAQDPVDSSLRRQLAISLARAGRADEAVATAGQAVLVGPEPAAAMKTLRDVCALAGVPGRFEAELVRLGGRAEDAAIRLRIVGELRDLGDRDGAKQVLKSPFAMTDPGDAESCYLLAEMCAEEGEVGEALDALQRATKQQPKLFRRADQLLHELRDHPRSEEFLEQTDLLIGRNPGDPVAAYLRGRALALTGQTAAAIEWFRRTADQHPDFGAAFAALADLYIERKAWHKAAKTADKAIDLGCDDAGAYLSKGRAHGALDEFEKAEKALTESFHLNTQSAEPLYALAEFAERRGDRRSCETFYRRILDEVDPKFVPAREKLVLLFLNTDRAAAARECFTGFEEQGITGPAVERCRAMLNLAANTSAAGEERLKQYLEELRAVMAKYPDDAATRIAVAMSYLAAGDHREALRFTTQALEIDPDDLRGRELKATLEAELLDFAAAAGVFRSLLEDRPNDPGYLTKLLEMSLNLADYDAGASLLRRMLKRADLGEGRGLLVGQLVEVLLAAEQFDDAVETAKKWLDEAPEEAARREAYVATLGRARRYDEALDLLGRWLRDEPRNTAWRTQSIAQLQVAGRATEAQQRVLAWLADEPDDLDLNRMLLTLFWAAADWDSAIEVAQTGAELPEDRAVYENLLGQSLLLARRSDEAVEFYRRRVSQVQSAAAYRDLISALVQTNRLEEAEQTVDRLLRPELARRDTGGRYDRAWVASLRRYLATIYQRMDRDEQAVEQLEALYELVPTDPGANNDLGYTWADGGKNLDKAEEMIRLAVKSRPRESAYLDSLGWVLYKRGEMDKAITYLRLALRHADSRDAVMLDHLGDALYRDGQQQEARELWEEALKLTEPGKNPPPDVEDERLHQRLKSKLDQITAGKPVDVAPLAPPAAATQPVEPPRPSRQSLTKARLR